MGKNHRVRIVAGQYGGRRLASPKGRDVVRPTTEKVREAVFSMLGDVEGLRVLDLFAGTGALGLEALSRGAAEVTFVERHRPTAQLLARNIASLGDDAVTASTVVTEPAERWLGRGEHTPRENSDAHAVRTDAFDLAFLDPPYAMTVEFVARHATRLAQLVPTPGRIVVETGRNVTLAWPFAVERHRAYGDSEIFILSAVPENSAE